LSLGVVVVEAAPQSSSTLEKGELGKILRFAGGKRSVSHRTNSAAAASNVSGA
jgi:hypothetical protein